MNPRLTAAANVRLAAIALLGAMASTAVAQSAPAAPLSVLGVWRGQSICLVRPSACHDEVVVYRITPTQAADSVTIDARKIVNGKEEEMGILGCHVAPATAQLTCAMPRAVWHFRVHDDSLTGELRLLDDTRFRDVRAKRDAAQMKRSACFRFEPDTVQIRGTLARKDGGAAGDALRREHGASSCAGSAGRRQAGARRAISVGGMVASLAIGAGGETTLLLSISQASRATSAVD